ncbi:helix-turn-helix transcriptional regulator [Pseudogracilibacillus sp. SE30717A]|uniref:helix-turn-helix domain-containing protein n=1 Tax=Pseudogracilibacillus sp. SE30717A TaxID=3098293 RepID=UPI00300E0E1F
MDERKEEFLNAMLGNIIGKQIRKSRIKWDLTQEQAAELIGCSTEHLGRMERGEQVPKGLMLSLIQLKLQVSAEDYLRELNDVLIKYEQNN